MDALTITFTTILTMLSMMAYGVNCARAKESPKAATQVAAARKGRAHAVRRHTQGEY